MPASRVLGIPIPRVEGEERIGGKADHGQEGAQRAQRAVGRYASFGLRVSGSK